jgi:predicted DNA-binding antitoxin AbrB/MazE fold protein
MSTQLEAVYENGVFRPLEPVVLPENQRVTVTIPGVADQPAGLQQKTPVAEDLPPESAEAEVKPLRGVFSPMPRREALFTKEFKLRIKDLPPWQPLITPHRRQEADDDS